MVELEDADLATLKSNDKGAIKEKIVSRSNISIGMPESSITSMRKLGGDTCDTPIIPINEVAQRQGNPVFRRSRPPVFWVQLGDMLWV